MPFGKSDEQAAFRRLFDDAYRPLLAYARRRTESFADAEEVVAETLLVAWRRRAELPDDVVPWLYGVARRVLANQRRGQARRRRFASLLEPVTAGPGDPAHEAEANDATRAVLAALSRLRARDQEVLRLAVWEGLSHEQIAISLDCSPNAAALRLHRARQRLRDQILKEGRASGQDVVEVTP